VEGRLFLLSVQGEGRALRFTGEHILAYVAELMCNNDALAFRCAATDHNLLDDALLLLRSVVASHRAAFDGDKDGVYSALESGIPVDAPDVHGNTALRIAVMRG
jgi:ankyrin repeat protein